MDTIHTVIIVTGTVIVMPTHYQVVIIIILQIAIMTIWVWFVMIPVKVRTTFVLVLYLNIFWYNIGGSCTNGDLRLVDGETSNEGRVEYCYDNGWAPVCSLNSYTATLMCKKLGYTDYSCMYILILHALIHDLAVFIGGKIISDQRFGRSNTESYLNYIDCYSSHNDLSECNMYTKGGGSCYVSIYTCGTEYGLRCYSRLQSFIGHYSI